MSPQRIQRRRTKGWGMPEGAVYVGRPTVYGNPWAIQDAIAWGIHPEHRAAWLVRKYRREIEDKAAVGCMEKWLDLNGVIANLRGKDLVCWCPLDEPCHADVLLEIANSEPAT